MTPLAVTNLQVLSGWFGSPHSYEQYVGNVCVSFVLLLSIGSSKRGDRLESTGTFHKTLRGNLQSLAKLPGFLLRPQQLQWGLFVICWGLVMCSGLTTFRENYFANARLPLTDDMLSALRTKSERVVIDDQRLAAVTNMIYPKQPSTLLGFERSFSSVCTEKSVRDYLLAKKTILRNEAMAERFQVLLTYLDHAYQFESEDVYLLHSFRKKRFRLRHDTSIVPEENDSRELYYLLIDNETMPPRPSHAIFNWIKTRLSQVDQPTTR